MPLSQRHIRLAARFTRHHDAIAVASQAREYCLVRRFLKGVFLITMCCLFYIAACMAFSEATVSTLMTNSEFTWPVILGAVSSRGRRRPVQVDSPSRPRVSRP